MEKNKIHKPRIDLFSSDKILNKQAVDKAINNGSLDFLLDNQDNQNNTEKE